MAESGRERKRESDRGREKARERGTEREGGSGGFVVEDFEGR
jgi:hypothetical protein